MVMVVFQGYRCDASPYCAVEDHNGYHKTNDAAEMCEGRKLQPEYVQWRRQMRRRIKALRRANAFYPGYGTRRLARLFAVEP